LLAFAPGLFFAGFAVAADLALVPFAVAGGFVFVRFAAARFAVARFAVAGFAVARFAVVVLVVFSSGAGVGAAGSAGSCTGAGF
jgi:hypothetical protein